MSVSKSRTLELSLNRKTIEDQIAALLYALGYVKDSEDIISIDFANSYLKTEFQGTVPLTIKLRKRPKVLRSKGEELVTLT